MAIRKTETKEKANKKTYEMIEDCGRIGNVRLTYGRWGNNKEKYDLRTWYIDKETEEEKPGKGIGLTGEQLEGLYKILKGMVEE